MPVANLQLGPYEWVPIYGLANSDEIVGGKWQRIRWYAVEEPDGRWLEIHHSKIPYSRGGSDDLDNLEAWCTVCNLRVGNRF